MVAKARAISLLKTRRAVRILANQFELSIALSLLVLGVSPATAQPGGTIRGVVTDERTGAPIESASVSVHDSGGVHVTTTNASGLYEVSDLPAG